MMLPGTQTIRQPRRRRGRARSLGPVILFLALAIASYFVISYLIGGQPINLLILGLDEGGTRSDVNLVAHVDFKQGQVSLVSLPRDTKVEIPGREGYDKLAHAYAYGQSELTVETVEKFLGIPIDYYVVVDLDGFVELVDLVGGVDLYIEQNMNYDDPYQNLHIHFEAGQHHLSGAEAIKFVRWRQNNTGEGGGDIPRTQRTQQFLRALLAAAKENLSLTDLPTAANLVLEATETNLDLTTMVRLGSFAFGLEAEDLKSTTLPGTAEAGGAWYWVADGEALPELRREFLGGN